MIYESMRTDDVLRVTHAEVDQVRNFLKGPITRHNERLKDSSNKAGLEMREAIQAYVSTVREELPDVVRVRYGQEVGSCVDINLDDWTFLFVGGYRAVDSSSLGEFWLEHYDSIINTLERHVLVKRDVYPA